MRGQRILFLGGNGHCALRLGAARKALAEEGLALADVPYPGFEGRPRAAGLEGFLGSISAGLAAVRVPGTESLVYATGIGGLIALYLRARGELLDVPVLLQAPVLWGLEHRLMPRLMRWQPTAALAARLFATRRFQRRFVRRHFTRPPSREMEAGFFDGYTLCAAFPDLFRWFTAGLLHRLERDLAQRPAALQAIRVWWGGRDRVVTPRELRFTEDALGTSWPLSVFPDWGHYPMIDDPKGWAEACREA